MMFNGDIQKIGETLGLKGKFLVNWGFVHIKEEIRLLQEALDPPQEMKEVEVVRYILVDKKTGKESPVAYGGDASFNPQTHESVKLTGYKNAPVVKRREFIEIKRVPNLLAADWDTVPIGAKLYAEWEE